MRFSKEIKALAKKIAKAEFDHARVLYKEDASDEELEYSEREYIECASENVGSLIADEIVMHLSEVADDEYNKLVKAKYGRRRR